MNKSKLLLKKFTFSFFLLISANVISASEFDANASLEAFKARTFLNNDNAINWATAIDSVVGVYVTKTNSGYKLQGTHTNENNSAKKFDLKDNEVFHNFTSSSQDVGLTFAGIFKIGGGKEELDELVISDIISVTDSTVTLDSCIEKKPHAFTSNTMYWCISAITLSKISTNKYKKTNKLASGSYGIATANGTFLRDITTSSTRPVASVSLIGPIINGQLADETLIKASVHTRVKSFIPSTGLEGVILSLPKE